MNLLNSDLFSIYRCVSALIYFKINKVKFNVFLFAITIIMIQLTFHNFSKRDNF